MDQDQLSLRTKLFALEIIRFFQKLPNTDEAKILGKQLLRSGTSVYANQRASRRSRSDKEFFSKLCIVVEECDESLMWLELLKESGITDIQELSTLMTEADELLRIFSASRKTVKNRLENKKR